jgi:hypothetical protein
MPEARKKDEEIEIESTVVEKEDDVEVVIEERKKGAKSDKDEGGKGAKKDDDDRKGKIGGEELVDVEIEDDSPEREAIRARRKEERKARKDARDKLLADMGRVTRENEMLRQTLLKGEQRINSIEQRNLSSDYAQIEAAIAQRGEYIERAKELIKKGVAEQNGEAVAQATEAMSEARAELQHLNRVKDNIAQAARAPAPTDPQISMHAREWSKKNGWYDPTQQDEDSAVAFAVDQKLTREGWNPRTKQYWEELDKRLTARLPHRYKKDDDTDEDLDDDDGKPAGSRTSGSGRESGGGNRIVYTLTPDRVRALKEAGVWEDPAERAKYVKRYIEYDKKAKQEAR